MVCLITGSSRGLGKAVALAFGKKGHRVVIHYKERKEEAEEVVLQIRESMALKADVGNFNEVKTLVDEVAAKWGGIDVLVNNAGITKEALLLKTSERDFDEVMETNLKGAFNFIRAVLPSMLTPHFEKKGEVLKGRITGHIINISSIAGLKGKSGLSAYSASKAALIGLTMCAARELSVHNIMVNAVLPGYMMTDMGTASTGAAKEKALQESVVKNYSDPNNVAEFICYLSGTSGTTGQVFNLDSRML
ncbi:MAG: SDR family NAD(P)-dependent oxidoreductase [Nitrospiraceae bacterium]|nr:MAG: SDR family NAD(P)-dependent oxidoreductase [Nitrospiraceae bacterium]